MDLLSFWLLFLKILLIKFIICFNSFFISKTTFIIIDALPGTLNTWNTSLIHCINITFKHTSNRTSIKWSLIVHFRTCVLHYSLSKFVNPLNKLSPERICRQIVKILNIRFFSGRSNHSHALSIFKIFQ